MRPISRETAAVRWIEHLVRVASGAARAGDLFDDELAFPADLAVRLAVRHRIAPLLHRALAEGRIRDPLPEAFRASCRRLYYGTLRRNVVALAAGDEILTALAARGVDAAPLKGWAFVTTPVSPGSREPLYPDAGVRPMDDLDFVVRPDVVRAAEAALVDAGFVGLRPDRRDAYAAGHEVAFHRRVGDVDVFAELHWAWAGAESLLRGFALPGDRFLDELCERAPGGAGLRPTLLGHVLFTAVHAARHAFERWIWLLDLHRLVTVVGLDWDAVVRAARGYRVSGPLYAALASTRRVLRTPVPKEVLAALAPGLVRRRLLERSLDVAQRDGSGRRPARVAKLLLGESWWDVARTAAWAVRPGAAWYASRGEAPPRIAPRLRASAEGRAPQPARALERSKGGAR
jgi:hypothetical protein